MNAFKNIAKMNILKAGSDRCKIASSAEKSLLSNDDFS